MFEWVWGLHQEIAADKLPAGIIDFLAEDPPVAHLAKLIKAVDEAAQFHADVASVIHSGLETARRDLLDLGLRSNPLLNYRLLRARGLEVVDELPAQVHHVLVNQGRAMSFLPVSEEEPGGLRGQPEEVVAADGAATRHIDTNCKPAYHRRISRPGYFQPTIWPTASSRNRGSTRCSSPWVCLPGASLETSRRASGRL